MDTSLGTVPLVKPCLRDEVVIASGGEERLHHHDGNLLGELQRALELFEADLPLTETQRALVRAALGTGGGLDATLR